MLLHHLATIALFGSMIYANQLAIGCIIALTHDYADLPGVISKILGETLYSKSAATIFIMCVITWIWTRCIQMPRIVYLIWTQWEYPEPPEFASTLTKPTSCFLLSCLIVLHYYWLSIFVRMLHHFATRGEAKDL